MGRFCQQKENCNALIKGRGRQPQSPLPSHWPTISPFSPFLLPSTDPQTPFTILDKHITRGGSRMHASPPLALAYSATNGIGFNLYCVAFILRWILLALANGLGVQIDSFVRWQRHQRATRKQISITQVQSILALFTGTTSNKLADWKLACLTGTSLLGKLHQSMEGPVSSPFPSF